GELVPFDRFGVVLFHAEAIGIKLGEQCHRLRIFVFVDALGRLVEGGEVIAALERAEGKIEICVAFRCRLFFFLYFCRRRFRRGLRALRKRMHREHLCRSDDRDECARGHATASASVSCCSAAVTFAATRAGSLKTKSPRAMKSAPACASGATSSSAAA